MIEFDIEHKIFNVDQFSFHGVRINGEPRWLSWYSILDTCRGQGVMCDCGDFRIRSCCCPEYDEGLDSLFIPGNKKEYDELPVVGDLPEFYRIVDELEETAFLSEVSNIDRESRVTRIKLPNIEVDVYYRGITAGYFIHRIKETDLPATCLSLCCIRNNYPGLSYDSFRNELSINLSSGYGDLVNKYPDATNLSSNSGEDTADLLIDIFEELDSYMG